jgi:hypothetical protein
MIKTLKTVLSLLALIIPMAVPCHSQTKTTDSAPTGANEARRADNNELELKKIALIGDLQILSAEASALDKPLARALAKAEIADAAWTLDLVWSKQLLRESYELTLPSDEETAERDKGTKTAAPLSSPDQAVRSRVLQIAARDPALAKELADLGTKRLTQRQTQQNYSALAGQALEKGDITTASQYIQQSIQADPTQMDPGFSIIQVASRDRAVGDRLIIEYINTLRGVPLSTQSAARIYVMLTHLVFPASAPPIAGVPLPTTPPGGAVMKAYVSFMIESLARLEQIEPGSLQNFRPMLMNVWPILRQYAPELTGAFYELEALSRRPGEDASLPKGNIGDLYNDRYEKRVKDALDSDKPDPLTIYSVISKGDFAQARRMIDKLDDGPQKTQLVEAVNAQEAITVATKGDLIKAAQLAQNLKTAVSIMRVYPIIVNKCVAKKDRTCAANSVYQAMKQLKDAGNTLPTPPSGLPASFMPTSEEFDPVALSLCKLAKIIASIDSALALDVLDEAVQAANRSSIDTGQGRTGLETDVFKQLAAEDETRVRQAAISLKQPLPKIVALAALYQWKSQALANSIKAADRNKEPVRK